jgi:hypothetical protein
VTVAGKLNLSTEKTDRGHAIDHLVLPIDPIDRFEFTLAVNVCLGAAQMEKFGRKIRVDRSSQEPDRRARMILPDGLEDLPAVVSVIVEIIVLCGNSSVEYDHVE